MNGLKPHEVESINCLDKLAQESVEQDKDFQGELVEVFKDYPKTPIYERPYQIDCYTAVNGSIETKTRNGEGYLRVGAVLGEGLGLTICAVNIAMQLRAEGNRVAIVTNWERYILACEIVHPCRIDRMTRRDIKTRGVKGVIGMSVAGMLSSDIKSGVYDDFTHIIFMGGEDVQEVSRDTAVDKFLHEGKFKVIHLANNKEHFKPVFQYTPYKLAYEYTTEQAIRDEWVTLEQVDMIVSITNRRMEIAKEVGLNPPDTTVWARARGTSPRPSPRDLS